MDSENRIRKIRTAKGLSRAELGTMTGLSADRVQKYENKIRTPKSELLERIAEVLDVNPSALSEPVFKDEIKAMFVLFELEDNFDLKLKSDDKGVNLSFTISPEDELYEYMKEWYDIYTQTQKELKCTVTDEEHMKIIKTYKEWKWKFHK